MITAKPEIVNSEKPIEHLRDRNDPLYWQMRQKNDEFLRRQYWWARHHLNGTLINDQRQKLAREAERIVSNLARKLGYQATSTPHKCPFDLWIRGDDGRAVRIEVKISLYHRCIEPKKGGRFQANIRHHDQADLLVFIARNGQDWHFVIPMKRIVPRHNIAIWSPCPAHYRGQWAKYLEAWEHLQRAIEQAQPQSCQLPLL